MYFNRIPYHKIVCNLLVPTEKGHNFSSSIVFPFKEIYRELVTKIRTRELSADCILYCSVESANESEMFYSSDYWCFGASGQGDRWLLNLDGMVYFYDHDYQEEFIPMGISFEQWLEMASILKQLDVLIDSDRMTVEVEANFTEVLNCIHPDLSENYPYSY